MTGSGAEAAGRQNSANWIFRLAGNFQMTMSVCFLCASKAQLLFVAAFICSLLGLFLRHCSHSDFYIHQIFLKSLSWSMPNASDNFRTSATDRTPCSVT